jgi:hypothetical protein
MGLKEVFDPEFTLTWNKDRDDQLNDNSLSGYDYALINYAIKGGFTDQEIIDLCVTFRRKHGGKDKYLKYYVASIQRARNTLQSELVDAAVDEAATVSNSQYKNPQDDRKILSKRLLVEDIKLVCIKEDPVIYKLSLKKNGKWIHTVFRNDFTLYSEWHFSKKISLLTKTNIIFRKNEFKTKIFTLLLSIMEEEYPEDEFTIKGRVAGWIRDYLFQKAESSIDQSAPIKAPFLHIDGHWYLYPEDLIEWAKMREGGSGFSRNDITRAIKELGGEAKVFHIRCDNRATTTKPWRIPSALCPQFCADDRGAHPDKSSVGEIVDFPQRDKAATSSENL